MLDALKKSQVELRKSEAQSRAMLNAILDLMIRISGEGSILGYTAAEDRDPSDSLAVFTEKDVSEQAETSRASLPTEVVPELTQWVEQALLTGKAQLSEFQVKQGIR